MTTAASHLAPAPLALPRARALTDELLAVSTPSPDVDTALAERLARTIGEAVAAAQPTAMDPLGDRRDPAGCVRVGAFQLLSASSTAPASATRAFRWTARRARRTIGLAALRRVLEGDAAAPAEAVAAVLGDPGGPGGLGTRGPGSCADWLISLSPGGRAGVRAEATTWATQLFAAVEWARLDPAPIVGSPDRWWACGDQVRVALRGRADVRLAGAGGGHLSMLAGHPSAEARRALCLSALVELLAHGPDAVPSRVAGWWPDAGKAWIVPIDAPTLVAVATVAARASARAASRAGAPPVAAGAGRVRSRR